MLNRLFFIFILLISFGYAGDKEDGKNKVYRFVPINEPQITFYCENKYTISQIISGDSFMASIYKNGEHSRVKVKIYGIEAPKNGDIYFNEAIDYLQKITTDNKTKTRCVTITPIKTSKDGTVYARVYKDGDIGLKMVERGYARVGKEKEYIGAERFAKARRMGMWEYHTTFYERNKNKILPLGAFILLILIYKARNKISNIFSSIFKKGKNK